MKFLTTKLITKDLKVSSPKVAIIVMAHNPYQYIAEFLIHHLNIADCIYLIDHRSDKSLSEINLQNVIYIESNQVAQFQSEVTNAVIRDYKIYENNDWIFVLDIDEFLPFKSKSELHQFIKSNKNAQTLSFNWLNGVGIYPTVETEIEIENDTRSLINVVPLFISNKPNPNIKVCVNCNKLKYPFYFRTGAHEIVKPYRFLSLFLKKNYYKSIRNQKDPYFIYHIIAFDRKSFYKKIKNYVYQMRLRKHVKGQGGWMVEEYLKDFDDKAWLEVIQNFRVSDKKKIAYGVDHNMFIKRNIFDHLDIKKIVDIKQKIKTLSNKKISESSPDEYAYIKNKKYDTDVKLNSSFFNVRQTNGIAYIQIRKI